MSPQLPLDEWLRAAFSPEEAGCPPPEAYLEAEAGALAPEERRRLDEHADRCPACAAERDLARLFDAGPEAAGVDPADLDFVVSRLEAPAETGRVVPFPTPVPKLPAPRHGALPAWRWAAAALLVLSVGFLFQMMRPGSPVLPPPPEAGDVMRGGEIEPLSPVGEREEMPAELRWTPREGARAYRVRLLAVDDTVLWETTVPATSAPEARLPADIAGRLHRAVAYVWTVEALDAAGSRIAASEPVRFRVKPEPEP
jgi:hypothetical protein